MSVGKWNFKRTELLLVGDFNARCPSWNPSDPLSPAGQVLALEFLRLGLHQCVSSPTHLLPDGSLGSTLDLVLLSRPSLLGNVSTLPPLGSSDHLSVLCRIHLTPRRSHESAYVGRKLWCFEKADPDKVIKCLQDADWGPVSTAPDIDTAWSYWQDIILAIADKTIPSKVVKRVKPKNPYVTPCIVQAIKAKRAALRRLKKHPTAANKDSFKLARNRVTHLLRKSERAHATSLHRSLRLSPSASTSSDFWHHMKVLQGKVKTSIIPDLFSPDSSLVTTAAGKADLLNTFFATQTVLPGADTSIPDEASLPFNDRSFSSLSTTPVEVFDVLRSLHEHKAPGFDGLPPRLLKLCAAGIAKSLCVLFNRSFSDGCFPSAWKSALVVPVFKKGARDSPSNYRPIALLPIMSKVMERIVHNKLYSFLQPWFNQHQSGFKKKDGTVAQLIRLVQEWSESLDRSEYVGLVFFDLKRAFDRVWHRGLLTKLRAAGVSGQAYAWFSSFLSGRRQATIVDGAMSEFCDLHAGVPQGAILSPLLFSIYVNDIPSCTSLSGSTNLFADDTSLFVVDQSVSTLSTKLQICVDSLSKWFDSWLLTVNTSKSAVMVIHPKKKASAEVLVSINGCDLPQVSSHRHLGLVINDTLTWSSHVDSVVSKASARIGLLRRLKHRTSALICRDLYQFCIRPVLE